MWKKSIWLLIFIVITTCLLIIGCNMLPTAMNTNTTIGQNQNLPVKKLTVSTVNGYHDFEVEIASNDAQRKIGLMNRNHLDENKGMLFIFESKGLLDFWMKNTLIPLDIIFISDSGIIEHISHNAEPCLKASCALYNSEKVVRYVLEINGGMANRLGFKEGDKISW